MSDYQTKYDVFYREAVDILNKSGSVAKVRNFVESLQDEDYRDHTFMKLASLLATEGRLDDALGFCNAINDELERADSLFVVGKALRNRDDAASARNVFSRAAKAAESMKRDSSDRASVVLQIASELRELGDREEALQQLHRALDIVKPRPQSFEAGKTLRGCARLLAKWNLLQEAIQTAQEIELPELRSTALEEIHGRGQWPVYPDEQEKPE